MTVNNIEVTVNTCTCTDVFTIITTKDQSGGIYNNYSTGGQGFMAVVNQPHPLGCYWDFLVNWVMSGKPKTKNYA